MNDTFERTLIITPHCDDETIGCGGLIHRLSKDLKDVLIVVVASSNTYSYNAGRTVTNDERLLELDEALQVLDGDRNCVSYTQLKSDEYEFKDGSLDTIPKIVYVTLLDKIIKEYRPTAVLIPYPSHHQDHKLVNEVCISALRPTIDTNFIKLKAMYEYTYYDSWNDHKSSTKLYVELTEDDVNTKREALSKYKSQLNRDPRDLLDLSAVIDLSKVRGREISSYYAEAYYPLSLTYKL